MSNTTISPNMGMPVPVVSTDPGPDWSTNINASLSIVDQHNHASGSGVQVTPSGLNINADLSFQSNNATSLRSSRYSPQSAALALASDLDCVYVAGVDLYYNDGAGNQIRITQGGSVTGSTGTITGLPSGTASASYSAGTFTFQAATLTPATMAVGPLVIGRSAASSKTVTLAPNVAQATNYNLTLPAALPGVTNYMTLDNAGALSFNSAGSTGSGAVVLSSSPTLTGTIAGSPGFSGVVTFDSAIFNTNLLTPAGAFGAGSAASPSVSVGFGDTGLYSPVLHAIGFSTHGVYAGDISSPGAWTIGAVGSTQTHTVNGSRIDLVGTTHTYFYINAGAASESVINFQRNSVQKWGTGMTDGGPGGTDGFVWHNGSAYVGGIAAAGAWTVGASGATPTHALNTLTTSGVGAAGGATALPATPLGYIAITINGTIRKIPYYLA